MAKKKKLTRFIVRCGGKERQILKIRDKGDELSIILPSAEYFTDPPYQDTPILEQRYSVHATQRSPQKINVIKQTLELEGGVLIETVLDTKGPKADKLQLVYARLCPTLEPERYAYPIAERDTLVKVCDFSPETSSLVFCVFVGHSTGPKQIAGSLRYAQSTHDFEQFRIILVYSFLPLVSHWHGHLIHMMSTQPRLNKGPIGKAQFPPAAGVGPKEGRDWAFNMFGQLAQVALTLIPEDLPKALHAAFKEVGFSLRPSHDLRKKSRRLTRRKRPVLPYHQEPD